MKRLIILPSLVFLLVAVNASAQVAAAGKGKPEPKPATVFFDDFDDGDTAGWWFDVGNWIVQDGVLTCPRESPQDVSDYKLILLDNLEVGTFSMEVMLNAEYDSGAVAFWRLDWRNQVEVWLSPYWDRFVITEVVDGQVVSSLDYGGGWQRYTWYKLRIDANSRTGVAKVWVNNVLLFTHTLQTTRRSGSIGLHSGSFGSSWDDFRLQWRK